jgi:C_GCAxxG_C_C family probable redox protein
MVDNDINARFDEKLKTLTDSLPKLREGINCAELTLTSILDVLRIDNYIFHNLTMPLAGGFGGYKSKKGWQGACGAVAGGCAALGVILGGHEKMKDDKMAVAYLKAAKFASEFEKEFGSVVCSELCGYDFSTSKGMTEYQKNKTWSKTCYKFVLWAVDHLSKSTKRDLNKNWK